MSTATITRVIDRGWRHIIAGETVITAGLLDAYERAWREIERELKVLQRQYRQAVAAGLDPTPEWLTRQAYWHGLQASIEEQFVRFEGDALRILGAGQREAVAEATRQGTAILESLGLDPRLARVRPELMERWVSALQPNSPLLKTSLTKYGPLVRDTIEQEIALGLGMGRGSSSVIRRIEQALGPDAVSPNINTLVRTEMHRTYRGAQKTQFGALQDRRVIIGYQWHAHLGARTCGACLAMHGRFFEEYPEGFHPNCRCTSRPVVNPEYLPGGSRLLEPGSGETWLREQPEKIQAEALGSLGRLEAFRDGETLDSMVTVRPNETWGPSVGLTRPGAGGKLPGTLRWSDGSTATDNRVRVSA